MAGRAMFGNWRGASHPISASGVVIPERTRLLPGATPESRNVHRLISGFRVRSGSALAPRNDNVGSPHHRQRHDIVAGLDAALEHGVLDPVVEACRRADAALGRKRAAAAFDAAGGGQPPITARSTDSVSGVRCPFASSVNAMSMALMANSLSAVSRGSRLRYRRRVQRCGGRSRPMPPASTRPEPRLRDAPAARSRSHRSC